ncbi:hypothetical protein [Streptomyces sp. NPDC002763]|uniref:hypothetical protein n=1 Tax=Streptomyces sp. NPDC002763 TaxID=3154427 RepID=UPI00332D27B2
MIREVQSAPDGFALWPVAEIESFSYLPLGGELASAEVGRAVMRTVGCNDIDPEQDDRPATAADPLGSFLHGLLTFDNLFAAGGMRVTDSSTGITPWQQRHGPTAVFAGDEHASRPSLRRASDIKTYWH